MKLNTCNYEKAILTGVLEVGSAHLLSGLNNVSYYDITNSKFSRFFGFTEESFREFVKDFMLEEEKIKEVMRFYNGYMAKNEKGETIKKLNIYSVMNYLKSYKLISYWTNTGLFEHL